MAFTSISTLFAQVAEVAPDQFDSWRKAWRVAVDSGSQESLLTFICRERGLSEELFLQHLARALNWPRPLRRPPSQTAFALLVGMISPGYNRYMKPSASRKGLVSLTKVQRNSTKPLVRSWGGAVLSPKKAL